MPGVLPIHPPVQFAPPAPQLAPEAQERQIPEFPIPEVKKKHRIHRFASKIKSVDGIDEGSTLLGQILPGIAGPIATASILAFATPLVWLGILGMWGEYKEAREEFENILQSKASEMEKLRKLARHSETWCSTINKNCGLGLNFSPTEDIGRGDCTPDELAETMVNLQRLKNEEIMSALEKKYGWTGIVGMAGMFAGMIPATGSALAKIGFEATAAAAAETAASVMSTVAGSFFLVGQVAMSAYAGNKARIGHKKIKGLEHLQEGLANTIYIDPALRNHIDSILGKEIDYIKNHSTRYGKLTIAGQACMAAGTIAGMSGAGLAVTVPLFAVGAPVTIGTAIHRILTEKHEEHFKGNVSEYAAYKLKQYQPINLILKHQKEDGNQYQKTVNELGEAFNDTTNRLAAMKCLSLLHRASNSHRWSKKSPEEKYEALLKRFKGTKLKRSQLEKEAVGDVEQFLKDNKDQVIRILGQSKENINRRLVSAATECLKGDAADITNHLLGILEGTKTAPQVDNNILHGLGLNPTWNSETKYHRASKQILTEAKSALKAIRFGQAHCITDVVEIEKVAQQVGKDLGIDIYAKPEPQPTRLERFQERITQTEHNLAEEAQEITEIRQQASQFTPKEGFPQTAGEKTVYLWQDMREEFKNDVSYHVFYIINNRTGKGQIRFGANACCDILVDPDTQAQKGARIFSIRNGECQSYGDNNNDLFRKPKLYTPRVNQEQQRSSQQRSLAS